MKKLLMTFCFSILFLVIHSQTSATVKGELLIQLPVGVSPQQVVDEANEVLGIRPNLHIKQEVSDMMRIWLFGFDEDEVAKRDIIRMLNTFQSVQIAQANHIVAERATPNDPFYGQLWHHTQANDHDIDSDLAWDITTGGLTTSGDSIVVCVVEGGGALWSIPDLVDNHWVNIHEIPDNGIDDDNNGYVDDYHGWSVGTANDEVYGSGNHGAQVSSMIGAKGNNNTGVVGVNWNVKLMQVRMGGVNESNVIAAYTYPLKMRKLYNQTQGEQGAFVVTVNSSWGSDFGQPSEAPLWCAMYDSLGTYGVLSCAATANNNVNVDIQGDLPTACPSDYLISVTNTNSSDVKVNSAGYGLVSIDLGAPGSQVYLANNTGYGFTSGTSFSSPCVAGAVALLYSVPCSTLMSLVNNDPAAAALQLKSYILSGVDQTEELQTQTVSGGRLNVYNSIMNLMEICGNCWMPIAASASQQEGTLNYTLQWTIGNDVEVVELRYRVEGSNDWISVANITGNSHLLSNLLPCSSYEFQLMSHCEELSSEWTSSYFFDTDGCCMHPTNVIASSIEQTSAYIVWQSVLAAQDYTVVIEDENNNQTTITELLDPVVFLDFLEPCTSYTVYVYSNCIGELPPPEALTFTTSGCGACLDVVYCDASGEAQTEYIKQVIFGDINHESTAGPGYSFIDDQTTQLAIGQTYSIQLLPGFPGASYNQNFRVWIDLNGNGQFEEPAEKVFDAPAPTQSMIQGNITIPENTPPGFVRMRVGMRYAAFASQEPTPCGSWNFGEVEDYCITLANELSSDHISSTSLVQIVPNPASDVIQIIGIPAMNQMVMYDMQGKVVLQQSMKPNDRVAIQHLPSGIYTIRIQTTSGEIKSARWIKP